jgi:glycine cleavage system H protein
VRKGFGMGEFLETTVGKFIFRVATNRLYSRDGVWLMEVDGHGRVKLGLTDYFQQRNGDVAFVHVKPAGTELDRDAEFAELETIKANVSLFIPIAGAIAEVNTAMENAPETINTDPYGKGWLLILQSANLAAERAALLDPPSYLSLIREEAEREAAG